MSSASSSPIGTGSMMLGTDRLARRWSEVMERPVQMRDGQRVIALDDATLRFTEATDGRGEGLGGLDLTCADRTRAGLIQICGIRFRLS